MGLDDFSATDDSAECEKNPNKRLLKLHIFLPPVLYIQNKKDKKRNLVL